MIFKILNIFY